MATIVSTPGGRRASSIAPAPSYAGVVSKYASDIASAIANELVNSVNRLVLDWKSGVLGWDNFLQQYQKIMSEQPENSSLRTDMATNLIKYQIDHRDELVNQKRTELTNLYSAGGTLSQQDSYNIERQLLSFYEPGSEDYNKQLDTVTGLYDKAIQEKIDNTRATLLAKYTGGGVTPQEQLAIVDELLKIPSKDTDAYNKLIEERAQLETNIANATGAENKQAASQAYEWADYQEKNNIIPNYEAGKVDGLTADAQNLANWEDALAEYKKISGQAEGKTVAFIQAKVNDLQSQYNNRVNGTVFDAIVPDKNGVNKVQPVSYLDVVSGKAPGVEGTTIQQDANGKFFYIDPRTNKQSGLFDSQVAAQNDMTQKGVPGTITVNTPQGAVNYYYDKANASFVKLDQTGKKVGEYVAIPNTQDQENLFKIKTGEATQTPSAASSAFNQFATNLGNESQKVTGAINNFALNTVSKVGQNISQRQQQIANEPTLGGKIMSAAKTAFDFSPTGQLFNAFKGLIGGGGHANNPAIQSSIPSTQPAASVTQPRTTVNPFNTLGQTLTSGYNKVTNFIKGLYTPKQ